MFIHNTSQRAYVNSASGGKCQMCELFWFFRGSFQLWVTRVMQAAGMLLKIITYPVEKNYRLPKLRRAAKKAVSKTVHALLSTGVIARATAGFTRSPTQSLMQ